MKTYLRRLPIALLLCMLTAACSISDESYSENNSNTQRMENIDVTFEGNWVFNHEVVATAEARLKGTNLTLSRMPCEEIVRLLVPIQEQAEALASIKSQAWTASLQVYGMAETSNYLTLGWTDYTFSTQFGGTQHSIRLMFDASSRAVYDTTLNTLTLLFRLKEVRTDGTETDSSLRNMTFTFNSIKQIGEAR